MRIVILDGYTVNPGDLSWEKFGSLGEVEVYDRTPADNVVERSLHARAILTNKTPVTDEMLAQLPDLAYIGVLATGYNVVDVAAARRRGIVVTNVPGYSTYSVAQHAIALLLELCLHIDLHSRAVHAGEWARSPDWCFTKTPLHELFGKTIGIIGHGQIGQQVGKIALALGMKVVCLNRSLAQRDSLYGETYADLPALLAQSDVVSLHCPLTQDTAGIIQASTIRLMKPGALLINTSRGPLVNEADLASALSEDRLGGAALDVLSTEPPPADNPLLQAPNCIITPHMAWATRDARDRLLQIAADNLRAFSQSRSMNIVNF